MIRIRRILSKPLMMICFWPSKLSTGVGGGGGGGQNLTIRVTLAIAKMLVHILLCFILE